MSKENIKEKVPIPDQSNDNELQKTVKQKDAIQRSIGSIGKYQIWLCLLVFLTKFPVAWHQMSIMFLAPTVSFTCGNTTLSSCPCSEPNYNRSVFAETIAMSYNLICDRNWLSSFNQSIYMFGTLLGSIVFGMLSDRFGRRWTLIWAVILQLGSGIAAAFAPEYWSFSFFRFLTGISTGGTMVVGYVLSMEFVGTKYRDTCSALYQIPFNVGHLMLAGFGYYFRNWVHFQLAISVPVAVMLIYFWLLPESPRWLLAINETDKAIAILEKTAKINNRPSDNIASDVKAYQSAKEKEQHLKKGTVLDLFRTPNMRKNIICISFNWIVCGYCYYGVSQYISQMSGDIFTNVAISATLTIPGTLFSIPLMKKFNRRTVVITNNLLSSACLLAIPLVPEGYDMIKVVLACIGVMTIFIVFVLVYLYCSELFPTVVRNAAVGFSSMLARVGSMVAPFVSGLSTTAIWLPPVLFGILPIIGAALCYLLPETKGCELLTTIEEGENFGKKGSKSNIRIENLGNNVSS